LPLKTIRTFRKTVKRPFNLLKIKIKRKLGWLGEPVVQLFRGFGNDENVWIRGRVIEDYSFKAASPTDSVWNNLRATLKRYLSNGLPGIRLTIQFEGIENTVVTDEEGFFETVIPIPLQVSLRKSGWVPYKVMNAHNRHEYYQGEAFFPDVQSEFGIISDVDDTFLVSYSTDLFRKLRLMLLKNAHTRLPFDGVTAFYQSLRTGRNGNPCNPIFFVSSSEWNLYDLLVDFCTLNQIPKGVFLLRETDNNPLHFWKPQKVNHHHKEEKIRALMSAYPNLGFILIGDSGQRDAEIYTKMAKENPDQVLAIYIRDVVGKRRQVKVLQFAEELSSYHIPMMLVDDTEAAAKHALQHAYITRDNFKKILEDKSKNRQLPQEWESFWQD